MSSANRVLQIAAGEIGYYRHDDPLNGTKYGRWFAELTKTPWYGGNGVPFCAMFVSYVMNRAGQSCAGLPGAYCPSILNAMRKAGLEVPKKSARPGDIVLFNWDGGVVDHIGFAEVNCGSYLQTIEGNTDGGRVKRRTRSWSTIEAVFRPKYDGVTTAPGQSKPIVQDYKLEVDGYLGPATTSRAQQLAGTKVDGVVSGQDAGSKRLHAGCPSFRYGKGGSQLILYMQPNVLDSPYRDGILGPTDTERFVAHYFGRPNNGRIDAPSKAVMAFQRNLNEGHF